ncbi:GspH/FimT family pseudopilin [Shewanella gaetbuli]|uniref:Type II secretion system protein H n=1 Tax=Shewanella gaetbuli TaxID=220752 RepID=A0A9X1ZH53_9GAMM|nr:GspH/FimT family pseudopilin [Shewanella gaetbuli]MCL1141476.1 GspH/FimT family pseudopilin [Shewanella gaetbuli]
MIHYTRPIVFHAGFNLIELMAIVAITSILATIAVPSFKAVQLQIRASSNISAIQQALYLARNMAINYGTRVTVCPLEHRNCGRNWQAGFSIFTDSGQTNFLDSQDRVLKVINAFNTNDIVQYNRKAIRFQPDGLASGTNGTFTYCPEKFDSPYSKAVIINQAGRVRLSKKRKIICANK